MSKQNPTIMVVEDEVLLLQAITKKLKLSGLDVISCASGKQALDYLQSLDELPDVMWCDFYLKDMNGLELLQSIKSNPQWVNIPVVYVSNSASPEKVHNILALGAKKYILKAEYRLDEIIAMMLELIAKPESEQQTAASTEAQQATNIKPEPETTNEPPAPTPPTNA